MIVVTLLGSMLALNVDCANVPVATETWAPLQTDVGERDAPLTLDAALAHQTSQRCLASLGLPGDGYVKRTEFDNSPYRFNMKPGQKLSAEEFDAWMASRGIRIVPAKTGAAAQTAEQ
ncbi:MAG: hypothetical protein KDJ14_15800 [Xanthomonadales bacterium]|nr:hypothetical protein [Xanthomonadales bacterium]